MAKVNPFELLTVTALENKRVISLPIGQVVALSQSRIEGRGTITTAAGGRFDTVEDYGDLVGMYQSLTGIDL